MKKLTERQKLILNFLEKYINESGYPPSIREIGEAFDIKSLRGVTTHLDALERKGYIKRESTSRSIQMLRKSDDYFQNIPVLGAIAAGEPILANSNIEGYMQVPKTMVGGIEDAFILKVRGDSMIQAHILDGDFVVIRPQPTAENGDLVAALLGDEATIKQLKIAGSEIMLMPANPAYEPLSLRGRDIRLIGKVIGLLRSY